MWKVDFGKRTERIFVRAAPEEAALLAQGARLANRTVSDFVRLAAVQAALAAGARLERREHQEDFANPVETEPSGVPVAAIVEALPPMADQLPEAVRALTDTLVRLTGNLTQLKDHASTAGDPVDRLAGEGGALERVRLRARELGLFSKSGAMEEAEASAWLAQLDAAARQVNDLSRRLNEGQAVAAVDWQSPLVAIQQGLRRG